MNFVGCDLHKKTITMCVVDQNRVSLASRRFDCSDTASYEWFVQLVEPSADRIVLEQFKVEIAYTACGDQSRARKQAVSVRPWRRPANRSFPSATGGRRYNEACTLNPKML